MATDVEKMMKNWLAAWSSHDVDKILSFYTDECTFEDLGAGVVNHSKKELNNLINSMVVDMPDFEFEMKSAFGAGDWVGCEWVWTGTQAHSSFSELPATGKRFSVRGASIIELRKGKISRETGYWNVASMLQQLGLMPASTQ